MKKTLALAPLALGLGLALCSQSAFAKEKLLVWEDLQKAYGLTEAAAAFEKEFGVEVELREFRYTTSLDKLRLDGPAGIGADVFVIPHDRLGYGVVQGLIRPLEFMKTDKDKYTEGSVAALTSNGTIYGCPRSVESVVVFYNKKLLDKPFETMEEYYDYSKKVHAADDSNYGLLAPFDQIYYAYGAISAYGGYVFKRDDSGNFDVTDVGLNNQGTIDAVTYVSKFFKEGLFPLGIIGENGLNAMDTLFTEGKTAAVVTGPWMLEPYASAKVDYGVARMPKMPNGKDMEPFMGVRSYVVSNFTKNPELAEKFIQFINQPKYAIARYEAIREIPPIKEVMANPVIKDDPIASVLADQCDHAFPMPSVPEMAEVWVPIDSALQLVATGKSEPKPALDDAITLINSQIEAMRTNAN
ncbi:MAG: extracellular solute-binding protein [Succinivibrio sp.]|nr:extracellular solute-binding protein [Succinivibrio sp.]